MVRIITDPAAYSASHRDLEDHLAYLAAGHQRARASSGEKVCRNDQAAWRSMPGRGGSTEELDVAARRQSTSPTGLEQSPQRFPAHLVYPVQHQLDVDVTTMTLQSRHLARASAHAQRWRTDRRPLCQIRL